MVEEKLEMCGDAAKVACQDSARWRWTTSPKNEDSISKYRDNHDRFTAENHRRYHLILNSSYAQTWKQTRHIVDRQLKKISKVANQTQHGSGHSSSYRGKHESEELTRREPPGIQPRRQCSLVNSKHPTIPSWKNTKTSSDHKANPRETKESASKSHFDMQKIVAARRCMVRTQRKEKS